MIMLKPGFGLLLSIGLMMSFAGELRSEPRKLKACGQDWACLSEAAAQCVAVQGRDTQSVDFSDPKFNKVLASAPPVVVEMEILYELWPGTQQSCTVYGRQSVLSTRYTDKGRAEQEAAGKSAETIAEAEQLMSQTAAKNNTNVLCQIPRRSDVVSTLEMLSFRTTFDYALQDKGRWQVRSNGKAIATCEPK
jgi:hypothetical protein